MLFLLNSNVFCLFFLPWCVWGLCFWAVLLIKKIMHARELLRRGQPPHSAQWITPPFLLRRVTEALFAVRPAACPTQRELSKYNDSVTSQEQDAISWQVRSSARAVTQAITKSRARTHTHILDTGSDLPCLVTVYHAVVDMTEAIRMLCSCRWQFTVQQTFLSSRSACGSCRSPWCPPSVDLSLLRMKTVNWLVASETYSIRHFWWKWLVDVVEDVRRRPLWPLAVM